MKTRIFVATIVLLLALSVGVVAADFSAADVQVVDAFGGEAGAGTVRPLGAEGPDPIIPPWDDWL